MAALVCFKRFEKAHRKPYIAEKLVNLALSGPQAGHRRAVGLTNALSGKFAASQRLQFPYKLIRNRSMDSYLRLGHLSKSHKSSSPLSPPVLAAAAFLFIACALPGPFSISLRPSLPPLSLHGLDSRTVCDTAPGVLYRLFRLRLGRCDHLATGAALLSKLLPETPAHVFPAPNSLSTTSPPPINP